jgi:hypothetical protein
LAQLRGGACGLSIVLLKIVPDISIGSEIQTGPEATV